MAQLFRIIILLCTAFESTAYGVNIAYEMSQAQAYVDNQQYQQAQQIYQNLLKETLEPWQREILSYNSECCLLSMGQWESIIENNDYSLLEASDYPLLARNGALNNAIVFLHDAAGRKNKSEANFLLKMAIFSLQDVQETDCEIAIIEGDLPFKPSPDMLAVKSEVEKLLKTVSVTNGSEQDLLSGFSSAVGEIPLNLSSLDGLKQKVQNSSSEIKKMVSVSIEALKQGRARTARALLMAGDFLLEDTVSVKSTAARAILGQALEQQQRTFHLTMLVKKGEGLEGENTDLDLATLSLQQAVLTTASSYLTAVFAQQKLDFTKVCQEKPCDIVIPLFLKGKVAADQAEKELKSKQWIYGLHSQLLAITSWIKALALIEKSEDATKQQQEQQKGEQQQPASSTSSTAQILQQLEVMDSDDKLRPVINPTRQEVEKPW